MGAACVDDGDVLTSLLDRVSAVVDGLSFECPGIEMVWLYLLEVKATEPIHYLCNIIPSKHSIRLNILLQRSYTKTNHSIRNNILLLQLPEKMKVLILLLTIW